MKCKYDKKSFGILGIVFLRFVYCCGNMLGKVFSRGDCSSVYDCFVHNRYMASVVVENRINTEQQTQIADLKRELEEMKRKETEPQS
jgi:uncharacterized protein YfcZ (UPF0381/DUF406 family)